MIDSTSVKVGLLVALLGVASCANPSQNLYQGYVEGEFVYLSASQSGTLTQLSVTRGQTVDAGAQMFVIDDVDEAQALIQAQRQWASARAQLADLQTGKRPPEVNVARAQLAQAVANAQQAALQLTRDEQQYRAGGIPKAQLDSSRANAQATAAMVKEQSNQITVSQLPGREKQIQAQAAQVDAAQASVAQAQWKLDQTRIAAPTHGLVYDTLYRRGEWVQAGSPVVQMLPPQNVKVRFFLPEKVVGSVQQGHAVTIHCDGCAAGIPATITYLAHNAEYTPPVIYSNDSRSKLVFMVEAHASVANAVKLHPGQPVSVTLP